MILESTNKKRSKIVHFLIIFIVFMSGVYLGCAWLQYQITPSLIKGTELINNCTKEIFNAYQSGFEDGVKHKTQRNL